jgi:hypothetical protein
VNWTQYVWFCSKLKFFADDGDGRIDLLFKIRMDSSSLIAHKDCCPPDSHGFKAEDPNYSPKGFMVSYGQGRRAYQVGNGTKVQIPFYSISLLVFSFSVFDRHCYSSMTSLG